MSRYNQQRTKDININVCSFGVVLLLAVSLFLKVYVYVLVFGLVTRLV